MTRRDLFVAEISRSSEHNQAILRDFFARKPGKELSTGHLAEQDFSGYSQLETGQRLDRLAQRMGANAIAMSAICSEINLTKSPDPQSFDEKDNAVYLPLIGNSPARTSRDELTLKAHNYAQIVLDPTKAFAPYVAGYFSSSLGRMALEGLRSGTTIKHVTKRALQECNIYLVPLETQIRCIQADSKALNLINEVAALRGKVWDEPRAIKSITSQLERVNRGDTLLSWMDALPFPLASILWTYHVSGEDSRERYEHLLHFFEALAEFYAIVMWSATHNTPILRNDPRYPIREDRPFKNSFERSTFGAWIEMASRLAKFGRTLLNGKPDEREALRAGFGTSNKDVLQSLFASEIIDQLENANNVRNRKSHGGIVGSEEAENRRVLLESFLATLRGVVKDVWQDYPLLKAGATRIKNGVYHYDAENIMGRSTPFEKVKVDTINAVDNDKLFLFAKDAAIGVPLAPLLFVGPPPATAQNACYFYSRVDGKEFRFISYHYDEKSEIQRADTDVMVALNDLVQATGVGNHE